MDMAAPVVLIACDKFKGTLTAAEACAAVAEGLRRCLPEARVVMRPIADGGEGTARVICDALGGEWLTEEVTGPLGDRTEAGWAWMADDATAVIEMSEASGLKLLSAERRNPWRATTAGTGELMKAAMVRGAQRIIVGIGGSATNDGGAGMAHALGYRFFDAAGVELEPVPANLGLIERVEVPDRSGWPRVTAACDVTNPLLGLQGATRVYGPQKGVRLERMEAFEAGLARLADVAEAKLGLEVRGRPGSGAAGGLGFGLMAFCGAEVRPGFDLIAEVTELTAAVRAADLVITGEGCLDAQTLHGKGPAGVAALARRYGRPVVAAGGLVDEEARGELAACFHGLIAAATRETLDAALRAPAATLSRAVAAERELFAALMG